MFQRILTFYLSVFCSEHCIAFSWPAGLLVVLETAIKFLDSRRLIVQGLLGNKSQLHRQGGQNQHLQGAEDPKMKIWVCCCFLFSPMKKWNRSAPFFWAGEGITSLSRKMKDVINIGFQLQIVNFRTYWPSVSWISTCSDLLQTEWVRLDILFCWCYIVNAW